MSDAVVNEDIVKIAVTNLDYSKGMWISFNIDHENELISCEYFHVLKETEEKTVEIALKTRILKYGYEKDVAAEETIIRQVVKSVTESLEAIKAKRNLRIRVKLLK